ncbi:MAG TPA: hypothetical protein GXZ58_10900 [Bacilli bacterium]|nr:hypothetical protein [Bacilli bacterium]
MQLKKSWYKSELLKQNFRQVGWISLIYFLILFFSVPLNIFMTYSNPENHYMYNRSIFNFGLAFQAFALFLVPVLMAMFILRYLHQKDASDFLHSLPIKRSHLLWHQVGFGIAALWIPIIINAILIYFNYLLWDVEMVFTLLDLTHWLVISLIMISFIYSISLIVGMLTGITIIQGIFSYIFLFLPTGFIILYYTNLNFAIIGLPESYLISEDAFKFSPLTDFFPIIFEPGESYNKLIIYLILTIVSLLIAQLLYKNRSVEAATHPIAFQKLKPIFIYSFTFCFTLIGGLYFALMEQNFIGILIGYLIFSIIGYFITQMIVQKTWRVFREWREYGYFFVVFTLIIIFIMTDITGYQKRIPATDEIESAFVITDLYQFQNNADRYHSVDGFNSTVDIEKIRDYHQYLIDHSSREDELSYYYNNVAILYRLENGRTLVREYNLPNHSADHEVLDWVRSTDTYKLYSSEVFLIEANEISELRFNSRLMDNEFVLTNRKQITEFFELLKEANVERDIEDHYFETSVEITLKNHGWIYQHFSWNDKQIVDWFERNGLSEQLIISPNHINSITFFEVEDPGNFDYYETSLALVNNKLDVPKWTFTDQAEIELIFEHLYYHDDIEDYGMAFYFEGMAEPDIYLINKDNLPAEILAQIN